MEHKTLEIGNHKVEYFNSNPSRMESKVLFDVNSISQKLIFSVMNITHKYGIGCSAPKFKGIDDQEMTFLLSEVISDCDDTNVYLNRFESCLDEIDKFKSYLETQLNFDKLDLSMFNDIITYDVFLTELASVKDQHYDGCWDAFKASMIDSGKLDEAKILGVCKKFEEVNKKDLALIGYKVEDLLTAYYEHDLSSNSDIKN